VLSLGVVSGVMMMPSAVALYYAPAAVPLSVLLSALLTAAVLKRVALPESSTGSRLRNATVMRFPYCQVTIAAPAGVFGCSHAPS
jgi:hypothetical protein